jgi:hypothetical protein
VGPKQPLCDPASYRTIRYGLLGPEAIAITYADATGKPVRQPVSSPEGAYLTVLPMDPSSRPGRRGAGASPATGLLTVEYRDGTVCRIVGPRRIGGARPCPLKGYVTPRLPKVTAEDLAMPIHVRVGKRPEHPGPKPPKGVRFPAQRRITISFRARAAADARSFYTVYAELHPHADGCGYGMVGPIAKDVKPGEVVTSTLYWGYGCHGRLTVEVGFQQQRRPGRGAPFMPTGRGDVKVGRTTVALP